MHQLDTLLRCRISNRRLYGLCNSGATTARGVDNTDVLVEKSRPSGRLCPWWLVGPHVYEIYVQETEFADHVSRTCIISLVRMVELVGSVSGEADITCKSIPHPSDAAGKH